MTPTHERIICKVNMRQKDEMLIGSVAVKMALPFETNYREKSPVIAEVVEGNEHLRPGQFICCHHNHFYQPSPYYLYDDLYSIPFNKTIFAIFDSEGELIPICGNMICEYVYPESDLILPEESRKPYTDRYEVVDPGWTIYKRDQIIFTRPSAGYQIVYYWNRHEKRRLKVSEDQVCGVLLS